MNKLDLTFTESPQDGREAIFLVDGKPIIDYFSGAFMGLALKDMENEKLLLMSSHDEDYDESYKIVGTCDCGIIGCNRIGCKVSETEDSVVFDNFMTHLKENLPLRFQFTKENYKEVMDRLAEDYNKGDFFSMRSR